MDFFNKLSRNFCRLQDDKEPFKISYFNCRTILLERKIKDFCLFHMEEDNCNYI